MKILIWWLSLFGIKKAEPKPEPFITMTAEELREAQAAIDWGATQAVAGQNAAQILAEKGQRLLEPQTGNGIDLGHEFALMLATTLYKPLLFQELPFERVQPKTGNVIHAEHRFKK